MLIKPVLASYRERLKLVGIYLFVCSLLKKSLWIWDEEQQQRRCFLLFVIFDSANTDFVSYLFFSIIVEIFSKLYLNTVITGYVLQQTFDIENINNRIVCSISWNSNGSSTHDCPSAELSLFQLIFIVRSYVELLHHSPRLGGGFGSR